ncbi:MAG TPA: alpha/beta hydrolase [Planctomycetota bacterium]|nr:alpha/beta hydrolase [Planctomycetota bacterium]
MADHEHGEPVTARRGFFWVGVERSPGPSGTVARGPMYVQWESPVEVRRPYPLVLVHGGGGQGTDWLGTPDGRPGWATYLLAEGYAVYVVDRPGHGRCSYHPGVLGPMGDPFTFELAHALFTDRDHPTGHLHTQWLGSGEIGDPALDQFVAAAGPMLADFRAAHALEQARGAELLDRIGPAIVVTHSAGGPAGWLWADARPGLVKALVAIEPMGPPFLEQPERGLSLAWGLAASPLTFDPPVGDPAELAGTARRLPNLQGIPIAVVSAEASLLAQPAPAVAAFLEQAGCDVEHVRLADRGVHGNGHLMMLERNSREALRPILDWLEERVPQG